jgi:putative aldouronate transport system substrate-binding protein
MKRIALAVILIAALSAGSAFGASSTYPLAGNKTFTYWVVLPANVTTYAKDLNEIEFYKNLEKATGVKIVFQHPASGSAANILEQLNILLASGDYPDMIHYDWPGYSGGTAKLAADKVIVKLNDVIAKWMPNLNKYYTDTPSIARQVKSDDGSFYLVPFIRGSDELRFTSGPVLRADWLKADGLNPPETIAEWETVMQAFKARNAAEAPFSGSMDHLQRVFVQAYDVTQLFYPDGKEIKFGPMEPGFKTYLTQLASWYQKGLIDKNFMTIDRKYQDAVMTNNKAGAGYCAGGGQVGPYIVTGQKTNPDYDLVATTFPVMKKGQKVKYINSFEFTSNGHVVITTKCKDVEGAARWLDYAYGKEGNLLFNFGTPGVSYTMVNGVPTYTDLVMKDPKLSIAQAISKYCLAPMNGPFVQDVGYIQQYYTMPQQKAALKKWSTKDATTSIEPPVTLTTLEASDYARIMIDINTYVDEMKAKFILGTEPLANLDKFQATIHSMGIDVALAIRQAALDRYYRR